MAAQEALDQYALGWSEAARSQRVSSILLDPRGSGQLFFMFIRPHPYTCLGIDLLEILGIECCSTILVVIAT